MQIVENYSLKPFNTFGIDAKARYFVEVATLEELQQLLSDNKFKGLPVFVLGGGSNILFTGDFKGLVIRINIKGIELLREDERYYYIKAGAGEVWHDLVMYCVENNFAGLENLSLIPGSVGAGPIQNIGAYGVELKDVLYELQALKKEDLKLYTFNNEDCRFGYRESVFKRRLKDQYIIISVSYKLLKYPQLNTSYGAIEKELEVMGVKDKTIKDISRAVCNIRNSKLPDPAKIGNAGSFFKNPEVAIEVYEILKKQYPGLVAYAANDKMKLAAGWLIEQCGWKGKVFGDAGVHKLQALVLVNYGNAKGQEIIELSQKIIDSVKEKFGVELEREVNIL